ncbi:ABC transporter substrate-binding protein [Embleya scabrispora]|uniref:ABC transporter substrate-binding protein n=1 Tax=Embleya scabrispora TaxID=159449 RepID=UPI0003A472B6|nr:ABC transporter substrate-binding protein [Embleya scabrispora]MYS80612.1 substrate-binding domain-containing protein [Streptomyces sp. SID5474]
MKRRRLPVTVLVAAALVVTASCSSDKADSTSATKAPVPGAAPGNSASPGKGDSGDSKFFVQADYDRQSALLQATPQGPADKPWEQMLDPQQMVDTTQYKKDGPYEICFSNASVANNWRQTGLKNIQAEAGTHPEIAKFTVLDAQGKDDKQISDIQELAGKGCSALIVSPNTTATLTPAVKAACGKIPVIVFDRGVTTDCPVTFINPVGGYAFGRTGAEFLKTKVKPGGKILALRILPGVDVLENRWAAGKRILEQGGLDVVDVKFTDGDTAKTKAVVSDAIQRHGTIDGVWMDAGDTAVAAVEAFEDAGKKVPPITGEDQQQFLEVWKKKNLTAIAPTYPSYQWRTPIIAALKILKGEPVPKEWKLPQPTITVENRDQYIKPGMPPLHYAMCGCETLPGYPQKWGGK